MNAPNGVLLIGLVFDEHGQPAPQIATVEMTAQQARQWLGRPGLRPSTAKKEPLRVQCNA